MSSSEEEYESNEDGEKKGDSSLTVSELTDIIKSLFNTTFNQAKLCIIGEISNFKPSKNNLFYTLKDGSSSINAVMWNYGSRKEQMKDIKDGKKVKVYGSITLFSKSGTYNLNSYKIELLGVGDLHQEYMDLKEKFVKLGYFDESIKKELPTSLNKIGIITAADGAALQDFLYVLKKNNFSGKVYIKNCLVQGNNCPQAVGSAIDELDTMGFDVIVVARGGGSFEDLFGFSSEEVIEAIYKAKTCIISAIGHEVDFMLSDFAADIRAPTPSIAGEIISGKKDTVFSLEEIEFLANTIKEKIESKITFIQHQIHTSKIMIRSPEEVINRTIDDINMIESQLLIMIKNRLSTIEAGINQSKSVLNKDMKITQGYTVLYVGSEQITSVEGFKNIFNNKGIKKKLKIAFYDGNVILTPSNIKYE